ncbi:MAG: hypothetical protein O3B24_01735 [Verrucomicrobia bacterium]|nr:hypothetical protein [Verrucomicrobiota bacterium]
MQLTDEQKKQVTIWVQAGAGLAEVQKRLSEELGISMTYMDVRFLVLDLGLDVKNKVVKAPPAPPAPSPVAPVADGDDRGAYPDDMDAEGFPPPGPASAVSVELDRVTKPGSMVSGTVTFGDGVTAAWSLDQLGRLALSPSTPGYQPSQSDVQAFQMELRRALERRGY